MRMYERYHALREELLDIKGNKCEICGNIVNLRFHHILENCARRTKTGKRGGWTNLLDVKLKLAGPCPQQIQLLCKICHNNQ